ncbi:MAG: C39 family peptidase [candidate division Zixibacteria bacterium]
MKTFAKAIILIAVVFVCFILLIIVKDNLDSGGNLHKMIFFEDVEQWERCEFVNCDLDETGNSVVFTEGDDFSLLVSPVITPGFRFSDLMLSWNVEKLPENSALNFEVSVSPDNVNWYDFQYQTYGSVDSSVYNDLVELPVKIENIGRVATDILNLRIPVKYARITVKAAIPDSSVEISLRRISICFASDNADWGEYRKVKNGEANPNISMVSLAVPYYTQRNLPEDLAGNCCSPTSVTMVLNYHEKNADLVTFSRSVYDPYHDMYGNWPYNIQAAYIAGMSKTWVEIHSGFDEIYEDVAEGKPVVISISFGYDELPNSPIHESTAGHIIAVVGFDGPDTVICNDPAGRDPESGIIRYPRRELERVWINHGGIAYHLWP